MVVGVELAYLTNPELVSQDRSKHSMFGASPRVEHLAERVVSPGYTLSNHVFHNDAFDVHTVQSGAAQIRA